MSRIKLFLLISLDIYVEVQSIGLPDYESSWTYIAAQSTSTNQLTFYHGFGEMPLLVDVQVKSLEAPNRDYIFPGVGIYPRDDDNPEEFGGVTYLYNDNYVKVSAPCNNDHNFFSGRSIFTMNTGYYEGPNSQSSNSAMVRVRAWKESSLPSPDFQDTGNNIVAGSTTLSDTFIERDHGLMEYPEFVLVRAKLTDGTMIGYMSDASGSSLVAYPSSGNYDSNSIFFGYNDHLIRVWVPSASGAFLYQGKDGYALKAKAKEGEVEIYAWTQASLTSSHTWNIEIAPADFEISLQHDFSVDSYMIVLGESNSGLHEGYRFPGSGAVAYDQSVQDPVCTYGGLTYAYTSNTLRLWRPTDITNGGTVCVPNVYGQGMYAESNNDVTVIANIWVLIINSTTPDNIEVSDTCSTLLL